MLGCFLLPDAVLVAIVLLADLRAGRGNRVHWLVTLFGVAIFVVPDLSVLVWDLDISTTMGIALDLALFLALLLISLALLYFEPKLPWRFARHLHGPWRLAFGGGIVLGALWVVLGTFFFFSVVPKDIQATVLALTALHAVSIFLGCLYFFRAAGRWKPDPGDPSLTSVAAIGLPWLSAARRRQRSSQSPTRGNPPGSSGGTV